jgi:hypothetical protein
MSARPYAVRSIGAEDLHFHDLRHTGKTFAASSGAGLRDLIARMGPRQRACGPDLPDRGPRDRPDDHPAIDTHVPVGGYRLRFRRHGAFRTSTEVYGTRAEAEQRL